MQFTYLGLSYRIHLNYFNQFKWFKWFKMYIKPIETLILPMHSLIPHHFKWFSGLN